MYNYYNTGVTVELGDLVDSGFPLFDFDYPVPRSEIEYNGKTCTVDFDKARLEQKIIGHYRFRQIAQETPARFKHYLKTRMNEIMPYYVQVYEFDAKFRNIDDPLESYNLVEEFKGNNTNTVKSGGTTKFSDTPQGTVENLDTHITNATQTDDSSTNTGNAGHTLTRKGNIGVQPLGGEVQNIRSAFINIDMQVIEELKNLFLQIY